MKKSEQKEIINRLSEWILIQKAGSSKDKIVLEGHLRSPDINTDQIEKECSEIVDEINRVESNGREYFYITPKSEEESSFPKLNLILFLITILTTLAAGAFMEGVNIFKEPLKIYHGIPFSATLLLILGCHEFAHYTFAQKHNVDATLPYFIPAPTFIGTFGAFIKMKSPIHNRKALIEIGASGPIAGFLVAVPALFIGLGISEVQATTEAASQGLQLGDSLLTWLAAQIMYPNLGANQEIMISSVGFAAWIGLLVTMLNLLPLGQLDGGHIAYAILEDKFDIVVKVIFVILLLLGTVPYFLFDINTFNWLVWAGLVFFIIKLKHPPVIDSYSTLDKRDKVIGIAALIIFCLTFVPVPISA